MRASRLAGFLAGSVAIIGALPAMASTGASIDVSRIDVTEALRPGGEYRLPTLDVVNPGSEPSTYRLDVSYLEEQPGRRPDSSWFTFNPSELDLAPGARRAVQARLAIPPDADPGVYAALIGPQVVAQGTGAWVGAAAAARLTFTVGACDGIGCWLSQVFEALAVQPALLLLPVAIGALLGLRFVRRRITISVARRQ
jgi:hypothetical protein